MEEHKVGKESATDLLECVRLSEMPQKVLKEKVLPTVQSGGPEGHGGECRWCGSLYSWKKVRERCCIM